MGYGSLQECVRDLERHGQLLRLKVPVNAELEAAEIHRRICERGGPAILYENIVGCRFPMVSNLFGTLDRAKFIFRDALRGVEVDHTLYLPKENMAMTPKYASADDEISTSAPTSASVPARPAPVASSQTAAASVPAFDSALLHGLQTQLREMTSQMSALQNSLDSMEQRLERIERDLGV